MFLKPAKRPPSILFPRPLSNMASNSSPTHLRIACYGFADPQAGSVSTAGNLVLRQLLARGHRVDFFNKSSFIRPRDLECLPNYRYIDVPTPAFDRLVQKCPRWGGAVLRHLLGQLAHRVFAAAILRAMRRRHAGQPYDVQLWLGDWAWGRLGNVPVVSWVQGPPETDARSIVRHKRQILDLCGWRSYVPLRAYAAYRGSIGLPQFNCTDLFIVGSAWSRKLLSTYGISPAAIHALAYPIDLKQFSPALEKQSVSGPSKVLWLGRTVPRKRLDLFLDACAQLIGAGRDLKIVVVGGFGFAPGYARLIERFPVPDRLRYVSNLSRQQVVSLLRSATVVVQSSEEENFGSTIAESLACGTPVVLGPTNGTGDYITGGGIRFAEYSASSVADAIARALDTARSLRPGARAAAERAFDPEKVTDDLISILHRAISQAHRADFALEEPKGGTGASDSAAAPAPTTLIA
jgi:glycosyltransferase involved in cell wall biosynthesis